MHPNANDPASSVCIPNATFDFQINGETKSVEWVCDSDSPSELATIAVFDSYCARAYLTTEQDVAYLPYGLDVVENLANRVLPELKCRLEAEIAGIDTDCKAFTHLQDETEVGQMISGLDRKTSPAMVKALGEFSDQKATRILELDRALSDADPIMKSKDLRLSAGRLKGLSERIETSLSLVSYEAIINLKELDDDVIAASQAEDNAAKALQSDEVLLPGTGGPVWKAMFEAARKFSTEYAYPGHDFPRTSEEAVCLLCQKPIKDVSSRLLRFEEYIQNHVAKTASLKRKKVEDAKTKIERANLDFGIDQSLAEELLHINEELALSVNSFQESINARRTWMLECLQSHDWDTVAVLAENPRQKLRDSAACQFKSARTFEKAADKANRKALREEQEELKACQNLSACKGAVLDLIERMKKKHALESCRGDLKTKPISDQSKVFASIAVTTALKLALDNELREIGMEHVKTRLKNRNDRGKVLHQLLLDLPTHNKLEEILSEGEQRAIAIASFLAELQLASHSGGIVFDDPVSSLDHKRRGKVAKRLAMEALKRQVIIFTHEVVFLHQLRHECQESCVPIFLCFLEMAGGYSGVVSEGLPWKHKSVADRIDSLEKAQRSFEKRPWPVDPPQELASEIIRQYSFLRATIERVVEDLLLNATVQRFRDYIQVKRLEKVVGVDQSEVFEIFRLYQRCHGVVEAHDPASAKEESPPTPGELKNDIEDLKILIQKIKDRHKRILDNGEKS